MLDGCKLTWTNDNRVESIYRRDFLQIFFLFYFSRKAIDRDRSIDRIVDDFHSRVPEGLPREEETPSLPEDHYDYRLVNDQVAG